MLFCFAKIYSTSPQSIPDNFAHYTAVHLNLHCSQKCKYAFSINVMLDRGESPSDAEYGNFYDSFQRTLDLSF